MDAFKIWEGGLGIWGAIALGAVGAWIGCRRRGIPLPAWADALAPGLALAQAIGRWGNWFNQELYGKPTDLPWALKITRPGTNRVAGTYHPTFLYESLWCVGVALLVIWADRRFKLGHGRAFALYVAAYCAGRGWIEYMRVDEAHHVLGLRLNVWTAIVVFAARRGVHRGLREGAPGPRGGRRARRGGGCPRTATRTADTAPPTRPTTRPTTSPPTPPRRTPRAPRRRPVTPAGAGAGRATGRPAEGRPELTSRDLGRARHGRGRRESVVGPAAPAATVRAGLSGASVPAASVRSALATTAASTNLPSGSACAPAWARDASKICSAASTSRAVGRNARSITGSCRGWIAARPSRPEVPPVRAGRPAARTGPGRPGTPT